MLEEYLKIVTFVILVSLIFIHSWALGWHLTFELDVLILFLCAYTLLLVLPIKKFKLVHQVLLKFVENFSREIIRERNSGDNLWFSSAG